MGEEKWWKPTIKNRIGVSIRIDNFNLIWGKCYDISRPYEVVRTPYGTVIQAGKDFEFGSSGREYSQSGTQGWFDLVINESGVKIAEIHFNCPWTSGKSNQVNTNGQVKPGYTVTINGFNQSSPGPLGTGEIIVTEDA